MSSHTKTIGTIGEYVLISEFIKNDIEVLTPIGDNVPYDFVIHIHNKFLKVQVKTTEFVKCNKMVFATNITNPFTKTKRLYTEDEVDLFGLYCIENGYVGILPYSDYTSADTTLRIDSPKNNQQSKIKMASDYSFDRQMNFLKTSI